MTDTGADEAALTTWQHISSRHMIDEGLSVGSISALTVVASWIALLFPDSIEPFPAFLPLIATVSVGVVALVLVPFRVRAMKYVLRADDFVYRRGVIFQRQVAVPYGRLQLVDISRGPVSRVLGLAELRLVTAAASSGVTIPGLPLHRAEALRDDLVALAESRRAGL